MDSPYGNVLYNQDGKYLQKNPATGQFEQLYLNPNPTPTRNDMGDILTYYSPEDYAFASAYNANPSKYTGWNLQGPISPSKSDLGYGEGGLSGFLDKMSNPLGIVGMGLGISGAVGGLTGGAMGGTPFSDMWSGVTGGADAPWGVNPQSGGGMDMGSENFFGFEDNPWGGVDLGPGPAQTNLQDFITRLDSTPAGKSYLNQLIGGSGDAAGAAQSALQRLLNGQGTTADYVSLAGKLGSTALGMYGANQQSNALSDLAKQYNDYGAGSRARFEASMSPGFDPSTIPGYSGAVNDAMKSQLALLSARDGNPWGSPGGLVDAQKRVISGTALPALNEYQRLNANTGFGNSMNAALGLQTQGIGADANSLNALGYGINALTNPQPTLQQLLSQLGGGFRLNDQLA